jgi:hypothetical protein
MVGSLRFRDLQILNRNFEAGFSVWRYETVLRGDGLQNGPALAWTIRAKELSGGLPSSPLAAFIAASSNGLNDATTVF